MLKPIALVLVSLTVLAGATACGDDPPAPGVEAYNNYRELEDARNEAESHLRQSISDINEAAVAEDREAVSAAAEDGLDAVKAIDKALEAEIEAAQAMGEVAKIAGDANDLENGLMDSRESLDYFTRMLNVALDDPFLETEGNREKVGNLATEGTNLAVQGELAVRKADRAIALALGLEPRQDQVLDNPLGPTTSTPTTTD
jgi:uncharacterized membrane protein